MQAVMNNQVFSPAGRMHFFGSRSYMMRSEKRGRMGAPAPTPSGRPPRRRRRRAGFFYKLFMMLLLIVLWPFGLLMLWQRKLRWGLGTKLLTSVVTLFACVVLFGFALTVDTGNAQYTKIQDNVNGFLDVAADWMVDTGVLVGEKAEYVYESATELGDSLWIFGREVIADGIDEGVKLADAAKVKFAELTGKESAPELTAEPTEEVTAEPSVEPTEEVTEEPSAEPTEAITEEPSAEPTEKITGEPSTEPTEESTTEEPSAEPTEKITGEPSTEPTEESTLKPTGEAELPVVVSLPEDAAVTPEVKEAEKTAEPTEEPTAEPTEEPTAEPTEEPTAEPTEEPTPEPTEEPTAEPTEEPTAEPTEEPTPQPTEAPTAEPTAEPVKVSAADGKLPVYIPEAAPAAAEGKPIEEGMLSADGILTPGALPADESAADNEPEGFRLKPAALAKVYYNNSGRTYHYASACGKMKTAEEHVLGDAANTRHERCTLCETPDKSILSETYVAWLDEANIVHMSDECAAFEGSWKLQSAAQANEDGRSGCQLCGADKYLNALMDSEEVAIYWSDEKPVEEPAVPVETTAPVIETVPVGSAMNLKPAALAKVYYNSNGKTYHYTTVCGKMKTAAEHVLGDAANTRHERCTLCETPDKSILDETYVAWLDKANIVHMSDECAAFEGVWKLQSADKAIADGRTGCQLCGADKYLSALMNGEQVQVSWTGSNTAAAVTATVIEGQQVTPAMALKSAAQATVYHTNNGKWYHTYNRCSGMTGGDAYALVDCYNDYKTCKACGAPSPDFIGKPCLWEDENELCHTSDECGDFEGRYTLIVRDDALSAGLHGCTLCGADQYLIPGTTVNYLETTVG